MEREQLSKKITEKTNVENNIMRTKSVVVSDLQCGINQLISRDIIQRH
jgi:hypothetical protein